MHSSHHVGYISVSLPTIYSTLEFIPGWSLETGRAFWQGPKVPPVGGKGWGGRRGGESMYTYIDVYS